MAAPCVLSVNQEVIALWGNQIDRGAVLDISEDGFQCRVRWKSESSYSALPVSHVLAFDAEANEASKSELYDELEVAKHATMAMIKKGYKVQSLRHHPDKNHGRETEKFRNIKDAYEILSGPSRKTYDEWGMEGLLLMKNTAPQDTPWAKDLANTIFVLHNHVYVVTLCL